MSNKVSRIRRAKRARMHIRRLGVPRLTVHRSGQHIYAQVIGEDGNVVAAASTLQKDVREGLDGCKNIKAATKIGQVIAERAKAAGVETVAFDRSGFQYHGRVKALAEAAREAGLSF